MAGQLIPITLTVNGTTCRSEVPPHLTLLEFLRDTLNLTGSKRCCGEGECGACTAIMNGEAVNTCLILAAEADGSDLITVEGLSAMPYGARLQQTFLDQGAVQCGFCTPGMVVAAQYLLMNNPDPTPDEIREGLSGNLCRCTGYARIVEAVMGAAGDE
ncbi:MAG: (2Fe-2S)-binding protein [Spirochaetaceae bacterium]|nr:MAG: (2Fe-2S)-binding protein [Spirochaetaceae bacterium]